MAVEHERKWVVQFNNAPPPTRTLHIQQWYLQNPDAAERVRLCFQAGVAGTWTHCIKTRIDDERCEEVETEITHEQARKMLANRTVIGKVTKTRRVYEFNKRSLEVDMFMNYIPYMHGWHILEVENPPSRMHMPNWLTVREEVTGKHEYTNAYIAKHHSSEPK